MHPIQRELPRLDSSFGTGITLPSPKSITPWDTKMDPIHFTRVCTLGERTVEKEEEAVCGLWAKTSDPTYHSQNLSTGKLYFLMVKPWFPADFPLNSPIESQILSL